jgi:carboxyl-terminal processing protease
MSLHRKAMSLNAKLLPLKVLPALLWLGLLSGAAQAQGAEKRLAVFEDVWRTINERYYDPQFNGVDWAAQRETFRDKAAAARDSAELYAVLRRMVGLLRDSHTRLFNAEEKSDWRKPRYLTVGVTVREIEGLAVVAAIEKGTEAERAGLAAGDVVLSVDGKPALELFNAKLAALTGSTPAVARMKAMAAIFDGAEGAPARVEWRDRQDKTRSAALPRFRRELTPTLRIKREAGVAVVSFEIFTADLALAFNRAWRNELRGIRGLVIDLRQNGGGDANAMAEIASSLLPAGLPLGVFTNRKGKAVFEPYTRGAMTWASDSIPRFEGPVALLTATRTASASEVFAGSLREAGRVRVVGESTCGCVLAINRHSLPDGGLLDLSVMDYRTAKGTRLEAKGVAPDEPVTPTRRDLLAGRDPALERALAFIAQEKAGSKQ